MTIALAPAVLLYLKRRRHRGKEDGARIGERFGVTSARRPSGPLVWIHTASVGEATSVLALMQRIVAERPGIAILATTGTVAAARLLDSRLPEGVIHQFVPVDLRRPVERFLGHWRPDLAIWVESELWPNLVFATQRRAIPMLLVNARLSVGSQARWRLLPGLIRRMLQGFALCLAQDETQAERFRRLGAPEVASVGDLKAAAAPLAADPAALADLRRQISARPLWLAASTHAGEEDIAGAAHRRLAERHRDLLTIIAPRHPVRGPAIAERLRAGGLRVAPGKPPETGRNGDRAQGRYKLVGVQMAEHSGPGQDAGSHHKARLEDQEGEADMHRQRNAQRAAEPEARCQNGDQMQYERNVHPSLHRIRALPGERAMPTRQSTPMQSQDRPAFSPVGRCASTCVAARRAGLHFSNPGATDRPPASDLSRRNSAINF